MCGNRNTTGSAVLWPCLVRLFLFMTTSHLDDGHAGQSGAAQHGGSPLQELWVVRSHADSAAGWCPPAPLMPQEAQSRVPEHGSGSPSLWLGFPQALWRSRQGLS
jgi:hypothetical protein